MLSVKCEVILLEFNEKNYKIFPNNKQRTTNNLQPTTDY